MLFQKSPILKPKVLFQNQKIIQNPEEQQMISDSQYNYQNNNLQQQQSTQPQTPDLKSQDSYKSIFSKDYVAQDNNQNSQNITTEGKKTPSSLKGFQKSFSPLISAKSPFLKNSLSNASTIEKTNTSFSLGPSMFQSYHDSPQIKKKQIRLLQTPPTDKIFEKNIVKPLFQQKNQDQQQNENNNQKFNTRSQQLTTTNNTLSINSNSGVNFNDDTSNNSNTIINSKLNENIINNNRSDIKKEIILKSNYEILNKTDNILTKENDNSTNNQQKSLVNSSIKKRNVKGEIYQLKQNKKLEDVYKRHGRNLYPYFGLHFKQDLRNNKTYIQELNQKFLNQDQQELNGIPVISHITKLIHGKTLKTKKEIEECIMMKDKFLNQAILIWLQKYLKSSLLDTKDSQNNKIRETHDQRQKAFTSRSIQIINVIKECL